MLNPQVTTESLKLERDGGRMEGELQGEKIDVESNQH